MFKDFYLNLSVEQRQELATRAGTTVGYIRTHLIAPPGRRKTPNKELMARLGEACAAMGATFGRAELLLYFYEETAA